ncbi:MAG: ABC transporter permease [Chromatiales bacterium]|jgi:ABC-type lipoprotein release transport system permease subunit
MNAGSWNLLARLAWRSVWRQRRRSLILLAAITLGVWAMIAMAALFRGWLEGQVTNEIDNLTGHVQIHAPGYRDDPALEHSMDPPAAGLLKVLDGPQVTHWASRVRVPAVVSSERESAGVTLVGIRPARERGLSFIAEAVSEGRYLEGPGDDGLLLGRKLAERLETGLGKRVVIMSQGRGNTVADRGFRIVGIFDADVQTVETAFVFTGLTTAQRLLDIGDRVSEIALKAPRYDALGPLVESLRATAPGREVLPWPELEPLLKVMLKVTDGFMYIWYLVVFLAMSFGLINTLLMAVFERTREIGLLMALGMRPGAVLVQVLLESALLLVLGLVLGNGLTGLTLWALHDGIDLSRFAEGLAMMGYSPVIYPALIPRDAIGANLLVILLGIAASLYPAWRAARTVPVEALARV